MRLGHLIGAAGFMVAYALGYGRGFDDGKLRGRVAGQTDTLSALLRNPNLRWRR
jgi:hypothetical protein